MSLRKFTKDVGRFKAGAQHDYPRGTWEKMAKDANMKLDDFTIPLESPQPVHQSALKGRPVIHKRLGGTQ